MLEQMPGRPSETDLQDLAELLRRKVADRFQQRRQDLGPNLQRNRRRVDVDEDRNDEPNEASDELWVLLEEVEPLVQRLVSLLVAASCRSAEDVVDGIGRRRSDHADIVGTISGRDGGTIFGSTRHGRLEPRGRVGGGRVGDGGLSAGRRPLRLGLGLDEPSERLFSVRPRVKDAV